LDLIEDDKELVWGNNANELNAAYAADGYARIRGAGAIVTTFGVGELSAINGIAGSYSEMLPVIHIVGTPNTASQDSHALLHHSLGNGDFQVFTNMSTMITIAATHLTHHHAIQEIDRVIKTAFRRKRPGYIGFPLDLMKKEVEIPEEWMQPLDHSHPKNPTDKQEAALQGILEALENSKRPAIVVDGCILRQKLEKEVNDFVRVSGYPTFTAPMGKGAIDESLKNFRGCYSGNVTLEGIKKEIEQADLLIELGSVKSDFNTGNFTYGLEKKKTIALHSFGTSIYHAEYPDVGMAELLPLLTSKLPKLNLQWDLGERAKPDPIDEGTQEITHNYLWNKVPQYMSPNSTIISDTGTSLFGVFTMDGPKDTKFISQILWGAIGYSVGSALGAAMADRKRQTYLFVGDGSFQMTAQEVSVMIRHGLTPVIFLLNNSGYLIEKMIHGLHRSYNNYQMWDYSKTLEYFGGHLEQNRLDGRKPSPIGVEAKVTTRKEFEDAMAKVNQQPGKIHFLEVVMPRFDAPRELVLMTESSENR
jgi:pyruvate decarboxylase